MSLINVCRPSSIHGDSVESIASHPDAHDVSNQSYLAVKGAAIVLSHSQAPMCSRICQAEFLLEIEIHLQNMLRFLRPEDTLSMAVRLQSNSSDHARYLAVVTSYDKCRESALIGFDCTSDEQTSIGLTIPIIRSTRIELDGDGGILVEYLSVFYVFKPVSIQAMWYIFQNLHKELNRSSTSSNGFVPSFNWLMFYQDPVFSTTEDALCSQWHVSLVDEAMQNDLKASVNYIPDSQDAELLENEAFISSKLRQIMQSVDLDEVTSKDIQGRLEKECSLDLTRCKEFIDREMMVILGQLEKPTKIFNYLYLGTEWNASNWDELEKNNVRYILNVSKEVDNFFPAHYEYLKIFVSDEATTTLLKHWQRTYDFIKAAKDSNQVVLVHCKKGISRSSSTVIAYIMKEYNWPLEKALQYVKTKRNCITPNAGFMDQLRTFSGILHASSNRRSAVFNGSPPN
ncbi:Dual specificity phosphatase, catalytic domain protein [Aphelenchoides besseyi]|nr:Dual specificity phosphatase, catalytic domain protein [Aphelenchoides besseyi]